MNSLSFSTSVSQSVIPYKQRLGGVTPFAFTEQGVSMLSLTNSPPLEGCQAQPDGVVSSIRYVGDHDGVVSPEAQHFDGVVFGLTTPDFGSFFNIQAVMCQRTTSRLGMSTEVVSLTTPRLWRTPPTEGNCAVVKILEVLA